MNMVFWVSLGVKPRWLSTQPFLHSRFHVKQWRCVTLLFSVCLILDEFVWNHVLHLFVISNLRCFMWNHHWFVSNLKQKRLIKLVLCSGVYSLMFHVKRSNRWIYESMCFLKPVFLLLFGVIVLCIFMRVVMLVYAVFRIVSESILFLSFYAFWYDAWFWFE